MDTPQQPPGSAPSAEISVTATPTPQQVTEPTAPATQPSAQTPQAPQTPPSPELQALQSQLETERRARQEYEQRFKDTQAAYTRSQQALKAYVGAPPTPPTPQDTLAPYVQKLVAQGYSEQDARAVAGTIQEFVQPLQQQFGAGLAAAQAQAQIPMVMQQAYGQAQALFADPWIQNEVQNELIRAAQTNPNSVTPEYAISWALVCDGQRRYFPQNNGNTPPAQQQPVNFRSQTGIHNNLNGHGQNTVTQPGQLPAHLVEAQKSAADEVRRRHNLPPLQS